MAQRLLAQRFQLKVHRELLEMPVYELKPARKGLNLKLGELKDDRVGPGGNYTPRFDFHLEWSPGEMAAAEDPRPSIFAAIQQLGLRLEPERAPVEMLVIDRVEKPSAN